MIKKEGNGIGSRCISYSCSNVSSSFAVSSCIPRAPHPRVVVLSYNVFRRREALGINVSE